ncbi:class I SAM-dependent methyltransferase [Humisphaera borealis]|uniref:Class I SAM-dependent methyltransferase n=1 Tax=Humisphaera borealis TaxID=2807512 RepID=A0A7M2WR85_9BACT|nr:class I SAM-dependent methyltransferase [Humisphaera borealis]QOV88018.1 class I SAM-dependent methyltransferase [Humisphaera borealis]
MPETSQMSAAPQMPPPAETPGSIAYRERCPLCGGSSTIVGVVGGPVTHNQYDLRRCTNCHFAFLANPCLDYARIYDEAYYQGKGADPLLNYVDELNHPETTVRRNEWEGVVRIVKTLVPPAPGVRWLDFGCGNGGVVRHALATTSYDCVGFDIGWITDKARETGIPILNDAELSAAEGTFDIVSAIEVIEHIPDPNALFRQIYRLLKPGGTFFFTTGNARPYRDRLTQWEYVNPDIHVSFFDPDNAAMALKAAGFTTEPLGYRNGCREIIRFKVLKNVHQSDRKWWHNLLPWTVAGRVLNKRLGVFEFPFARKPIG